MKKAIFGLRMICALAVSLFAFIAAGCSGDEPGVVTSSSFVVKGVDSSVIEFKPGENRTYQVDAENIVRISISQPAGWTAEYDDVSLVIAAPASSNGVSTMGDVVIKYTGSDGVSGQVTVHVKVNFGSTPPQPKGSFEIITAANENSIDFIITPDDQTQLYQIAIDTKASYDSFASDEEFVQYDIDYFQNLYGDDYVTKNLVSGTFEGTFTEIPDGTYIIYAYYVDTDTSTGYGFSKDFVVVGGGGTVVTPTEPALELEYHIDNSPSWVQLVPGYNPATQGIVVCAGTPNELVSDWYYGVFRPENCNSLSDDAIRAGLKGVEDLHNKPVIFYPFDWDTELVLCGFYVDMDGNEGPVERIPFVVSMNPSAPYAYEDYLGEWIVSGTGVRGNKVEYEISIEENMYNDSFKIFGFTRTGKDKTCNAPVRVSFTAGAIEFYESSTLGMDSDGNWLGFLGYAYDMANPSNVGYFDINHQTIATGVRSGNNIILDWKTFTYEDYKFKYYTFVYGYLTEDELRNEYFYLYDEDLQDYIVSDMIFTKKAASTANVSALLARKRFVRHSAK